MRKIIFVLILYTLCFANNPDTLWYTDPNDLPNVGILKNTTYTLKILLIEFSDVFHDNKYTIENWNDLFFSKNKYATPTMLSPDGEAVYGSMRDYYSIMSNGNFDITGYILNKDNNNDGKPDWIALSKYPSCEVHLS